jgi:undecaprenyl-diphosphatase
MEWLEGIDQSIVLAINSWWSPFADDFFWIVSAKLTWVPFYILSLSFVWKSYGVKGLLRFLTLAILSIGLADFVSSGILKEGIARYRPSHHLILGEKLRFHQIDAENVYRGGMYGFVSGHATNFAAIATWLVLLFWKKRKWLAIAGVIIALLSAYSRMYLGVHYLSDILGGMTLGTIIVILAYKLAWIPWQKESKVK